MYLCFIALNAFACAINDDDNFNTQTEEDLQESLKKRAIMRKRVAIAARVIRWEIMYANDYRCSIAVIVRMLQFHVSLLSNVCVCGRLYIERMNSKLYSSRLLLSPCHNLIRTMTTMNLSSEWRDNPGSLCIRISPCQYLPGDDGSRWAVIDDATPLPLFRCANHYYSLDTGVELPSHPKGHKTLSLLGKMHLIKPFHTRKKCSSLRATRLLYCWCAALYVWIIKSRHQ